VASATEALVTQNSSFRNLVIVKALIDFQPFLVLIDSGASISLLPTTFSKGRTLIPISTKIASVTGTSTASHCVKLVFGFENIYPHFKYKFIVHDISRIIVGNDILKQLALTID